MSIVLDCKLYRNVGTPEVPVWEQIANVRDLHLRTRGNRRWSANPSRERLIPVCSLGVIQWRPRHPVEASSN